jgi:hypothetical protein
MNIKRTYDPHRDLLELHGLERPACINTLVPRGSHHISSLWSPVVATGGRRSQIQRREERQKQAKTVAVGCDQLPFGAGKEGVDGSSPSEGFSFVPAWPVASVVTVDAVSLFRRRPSVHQRPRVNFGCIRSRARVRGDSAVVRCELRSTSSTKSRWRSSSRRRKPVTPCIP